MSRPEVPLIEYQGLHIQALYTPTGIWLRGTQLGGPLGLGYTAQGVNNLYTRHRTRFTVIHTVLVKRPDLTAPAVGRHRARRCRMFSPAGLVLLAELAATPAAQEFAAWVKSNWPQA